MDSPEFILRSLILWMLLLSSTHRASPAKLSPDQKAPPFARGSGGLILKAPFEGEQRFSGTSNAVEDVEREETETYKLVDGEPIRTVAGHFSYRSPEGLPIFVKYEADENGNRASFKFGSGSVEIEKHQENSVGTRPPGVSAAGQGQGQGQGQTQGQDTDGSNYLPPKNIDRSYLPPQ